MHQGWTHEDFPVTWTLPPKLPALWSTATAFWGARPTWNTPQTWGAVLQDAWLYKLKLLKSSFRSLGCPHFPFPIIHEGPQTSPPHTLKASGSEMFLFTDHTMSLQGSHCAVWYSCCLITLNSFCQKIGKWEATILKSKITLIIRNLLCAPIAMSCGLGEIQMFHLVPLDNGNCARTSTTTPTEGHSDPGSFSIASIELDVRRRPLDTRPLSKDLLLCGRCSTHSLMASASTWLISAAGRFFRHPIAAHIPCEYRQA